MSFSIANLVIYKSVILSVIPSIFLMFLGSWSDRKQRRKPCILLPIIAEQLACCGFILCTYFFYELPIWVNVVFEAVPQALSGGWLSIFMGVYSYVSTISTLETRTIRIGAVHMFLNISICLGLSLSGILYQHLGFYGVYSIAFVMYTIGLVYGVFFVKEVPKQHQEIVEKERNFIVDFVDLKHVRETLKVCFKTGERNRRMRVCAIMVLVVLVVGPLIGELNVSYMFARYKFDWSATDYSIFSTFQFVVHVFGTIFSLTLFTKILKVDDTVLGMASCLSKIFAGFVYAFASQPVFFYLGALVELLNGTSSIAMRSITSKLVPTNELGKINSFFGLCEAIVPIIYGPLYSKMYSNTINSFPGAFYLAGSALTIPALLIFLWLYLEHLKDLKHLKSAQKQQEKLLSVGKTFKQTPF